MKSDSSSCVSCGMPMRSAADHCQGDMSKPFCIHCGSADGTLKSYDDVLRGMSAFLERTQGLDTAVARKAATGMMAQLPAWRGR